MGYLNAFKEFSDWTNRRLSDDDNILLSTAKLVFLSKTKNEVFQLLKKTIRPEFLNRIDEVSMFEPLNRESITKIAEIQLELIKKRLEESKITLELTTSALDWLAQLGYDPQFGARPLKRVMQKRLLDELSKKILSGALKPGGNIRVDFEKDLVFSND